MNERVFCIDCDHVVEKKGRTGIWLCIRVPRSGSGFVTHNLWDNDFPYHRCQDVNRYGNCGWFTPARKPEENEDEN